MSKKYQRPESISDDMGGTDDHLDQRMRDVMMLLECAPLDQINTVLDVGVGKGQLAKSMAQKGKVVTGIGLELQSYGLDTSALLVDHGINIVEASANRMPFSDGAFDAVIMSHILEHVGNVTDVLLEVRRVLKPTGYLLLFVPPHEDYVVAGHVSVGWNIGQLIYVLLVNGFNVKTGQFIEYGYNVCAFVQKSVLDLPPLRGDRGDIHILDKAQLLPVPIFSTYEGVDQFWGRIKAVNWPNPAHLTGNDLSPQMKMLRNIARILPFKHTMGKTLGHLGRLLTEEANRDYRVNPRFLKGR